MGGDRRGGGGKGTDGPAREDRQQSSHAVVERRGHQLPECPGGRLAVGVHHVPPSVDVAVDPLDVVDEAVHRHVVRHVVARAEERHLPVDVVLHQLVDEARLAVRVDAVVRETGLDDGCE